MANSTYGFRTALSGFHKGDVVEYIEKSALRHRSELLTYEQQIISLQEENRSLQQQLNLMMMATPLTQASAPAPVIAPPPVEKAEPIVAPPVEKAEPIAPVADSDLTHLELLAYRRAEAVEHTAHQRAKKLYQQMEDLCEHALNEFQTTDVALKQAVQVILSQLDSLNQSYQQLADALHESKNKLSSMNTILSMDSED